MTRTPKSAPSDSRAKRRAEAFQDVLDQRWGVLKKALGPRYHDCTVETFDVEDENPKFAEAKRVAVAHVRGYLDDLRGNVRAGKNVLFFGPKGTGKDHLLVGMLREAVYDGANCRWWDGLSLFAELHRMIGAKESDIGLLTKLVEADVCAISDPVPPRGAAVSDFAAAFLFRLIDGRYRRQRPTWITANLGSQEESEARLAPQIHDRLRDGSLQVKCTWQSYRRPDE